MAYRIERIIPGDFRDYLMNLWEGTDLPSFIGATSKAYLFDDKDVADAVAQRLAAKCSRTMEAPHLKSQPITYEVVEVYKHAWGQFAVYSHDKWQEQFPNAVPAGRYDKLEDAKKHAESVTYKMVVVDMKAESRGFIYTNWSCGITPEQCGASQLACNIIIKTFLSLDGFAAMRKQMAGTTYTAEQFGAELARIVDRELASSLILDASDETELFYAFKSRGSSDTQRKVAKFLRETDSQKGRSTPVEYWYAEP